MHALLDDPRLWRAGRRDLRWPVLPSGHPALDAWLTDAGRREALRREQAETWLREAVRDRFGRDGLRRAGSLTLGAGESPFARMADVAAALSRD